MIDPGSLKNDPVIGKLLPVYTEAQKLIMKGTMDFVAMNYYSASYVSNAPGTYPGNYTGSYTNQNGVALGPISGTSWQTVYGPGLRIVANVSRFLHSMCTKRLTWTSL
jgi:beta-glucosidase/6-phospho-beta-glucosidase/beta-galactosidase